MNSIHYTEEHIREMNSPETTSSYE